MTKQEKVQFVIDTLQEKYPEIPIPLDHKDPYTLLVAVVLSAQCKISSSPIIFFSVSFLVTIESCFFLIALVTNADYFIKYAISNSE